MPELQDGVHVTVRDEDPGVVFDRWRSRRTFLKLSFALLVVTVMSAWSWWRSEFEPISQIPVGYHGLWWQPANQSQMVVTATRITFSLKNGYVLDYPADLIREQHGSRAINIVSRQSSRLAPSAIELRADSAGFILVTQYHGEEAHLTERWSTSGQKP